MSNSPVAIVTGGAQGLGAAICIELLKTGYKLPFPYTRDGEPMARDTIFWARHRLKCDEAHFWLNGYVNKQNCRIWSEANPQAYVETPLHPEKLAVWCALWAGGIIGPYFFKNDEWPR
ncbi:uncharacterized protein TNCV_4120561 [Trichonephila clavipes]|nr:uncharacterized protein TNCV_4120561 [Trichonephila clavipes]